MFVVSIVKIKTIDKDVLDSEWALTSYMFSANCIQWSFVMAGSGYHVILHCRWTPPGSSFRQDHFPNLKALLWPQHGICRSGMICVVLRCRTVNS